MKKHLWKLVGLVALLALLVGAVPLAAEEAEPAGPINSLRVYGRAGATSFGIDNTWWYEDVTGPFDLTSREAPEKDFVVFNPAILLDWLDPLGSFIKAGRDAGEKVHARLWYDPTREEPMGDTYPEVVDPDAFADIVFEYTYIFIDDYTHEPTMGRSFAMGDVTQMAFPMAGLGGPIGLDRYDIGPYEDVNVPVEPASPEVLRLEAVTRGVGDVTTDSTIVVSPQPTAGGIRVEEGQWIEFFDYAVKVIDAPTSDELKVEVAIYYTGWQKDKPYYVGSTNLWMYDKAAVDARFGPVRESWSQEFWRTPEPVTRPFWVEATHVGTDYVKLTPYRYLQTGETFFVDGAEYDVAAIYTAGPEDCTPSNCPCWVGDEWDPCGCDRALKYITLQSPLPKRVEANAPDPNGDVYIKDISVYKRTVRPDTSLPMLPPFNMVHDEVDDTNIPDCWYGEDAQLPDNINTPRICDPPDFLHPSYDTIAERIMQDTPPYDGDAGDPMSYIAWTEEAKEERFDTNLTEEKFTEEGWECQLQEKYGERIEKFRDWMYPPIIGSEPTELSAAAAQQEPQMQLALLLDSSGSIEEDNWDIIVNGVADALEDEECFPHDGTIELTVVKFHTDATVEVGPVVITAANAAAVASDIRNISFGNGSTCMSCGFEAAANALSGSPHFHETLRQVVNVVSDGEPYPESNATAVAARNNLLATLGMRESQDEIDAEAIGDFDISFLVDDIVFPQPGYIAPPFGEGGWVREVADAEELAATMCEKFQVLIKTADIAVDKTWDTSADGFVPGTVEEFTWTVENLGPDAAPGVVVMDMPADWDPELTQLTGDWGLYAIGAPLAFHRVEPLEPQDSDSVTMFLEVPSDAHLHDPDGDGVAWNCISATSDLPDPDLENNAHRNARCYPMDFAPVSALSAELTALTPEVAEDGTALFKLTIYNAGPSDAAGVTITLNPGAGWINPVVAPAEALTTGLYVPAGGHTEVFISAKADAAAVAPGDVLTNEATVVVPDGYTDPYMDDNTDTATVTVVDALPDADVEVVSISLADSNPIVPGNSYTFNITARNNGPAAAYGAVLAFSFLDANYIHDDDTAPAGWSWAMDPGVFLATAPMAAGAEQDFSLTVRVPPNAHYVAPDPFDMVDATIAAANPDPNIANNYKAAFFDTQLEATLNIEKTLLNKKPAPGEFALWEIVVCNDGPSDVDGVAVLDFPGLNLNANTLELSSDAGDLYIPAGQCVDVMARAKVKSSSDETEDFCNRAEVDDANVDPGATTLDPIVNEPSVYHCWDVGRPGTFWYGKVDRANECGEGIAALHEYFADCNGDGRVNEQDVAVYVDGVQVPVLAISPRGYVLLEQDYGIYADVTIDYCWTKWVLIEEEYWRWINIETMPWDYTEFILPMRPDVTDPDWEDGDYILVGSWITQEDVRFKFVYDAAVGKIHSADVYINDAEYNEEFRGVAASSLRAYGDGALSARFPYTRFDGPFNIGDENDQKPDKDFIVHNPALLNHWDQGLFGRIKADEDAHEKVHLRTWYVPIYPEPLGRVWDDVPPVDQFYNPYGDIVNEYTYLFLDDTTQNPTHGSYDRTDMVFPMASGCGLGADNPQVGLDRYDVNNDGTDEIMSVEYIRQDWNYDGYWTVCEPFEPTTNGEIVVAPKAIEAGNMKLNAGGQIEFFDYLIKLNDTSTSQLKADLEVFYTGYSYDEPMYIGDVTLWQELANAAVVDAGQWDVHVSFDRHFDTIPLESAWPGEGMVAVDRPFGFVLTYVGDDYVSLTPYRILRTGETLWVDGAEYDVAALGITLGDQWSTHVGCELAELKYITLRNPLPKGSGMLYLPWYTVYKVRFGAQVPLPVLPPFNMEHDLVDDVNIPDYIVGDPDGQYPDNPGPDLHADYDTILERLIEDQEPLVFWWLAEEKEPRFDTNLTEEKFTYLDDGSEKWMWINIETMPWYFTEFVLPEIPEAAGLEGMGYIGDYILVSSFVTEDGVRVKFSYDPSDGTGLYVNSDLCEPARVLDVDSNSPVHEYADILLTGVVENADTFTWDFGSLICTGGDTLAPTCSSDDLDGSYEVCLTAENECAEHTLCADVEVIACLGDFAAPFGFRDLADIMAMLPAWNSDCGDPEYDEMFDFNDDCHIGLSDIMQVVAVWNTPCPGGMP